MDASTFISLGGLGLLAWMVKAVYETRGDVRVIKAKLGLNGQGPGMLQDIAKLQAESETVDKRITDSRHSLRNEIFDRFDQASS